MFSRYDAMNESKVLDSVDQTNFPDPLSVNFNNFHLTELPKLRAVSKVDIDRLWIFMLKQYTNIAEGDDVMLIINGIPYLGMVEIGASLYLPVIADIYNVKNLAGVP
jgi:hypothetical protein